MAATDADRRDASWPADAPRQRRRFPWSRSEPRERRRTRWSEFREAYPRIVTAMALGLAGLLALDLFLLYKVWDYRRDIRGQREAMTATERARADALTASEENRAQLEQALVRQQAVKDTGINLSVELQQGTMDLQREGAQLRAMRVEIGPELTVGEEPGARRITPPLGRRQVAAVVDGSYAWEVPAWVWEQRGRPPAAQRVRGALGQIAVLLDDGTVIYSRPKEGPLADDDYVLPGAVRADAGDLAAIRPNLATGVPVYFH
ncbi:MAG TPA: hypothetical protein VMR21_03750 [Vicinamibacteria bacterium]|nr:hypothetical protein [Vicinamibacteria bacterium]